MRRHIIGLIGIAGLATAMYFLIMHGYKDGLEKPFASLSLRIGIVMIAIWIGMPDLDRLFSKYPPWIFGVAIGSIILIVRSPRFFPFVIALLVIGIAFQFVTRFFAPAKKKKRSE